MRCLIELGNVEYGREEDEAVDEHGDETAVMKISKPATGKIIGGAHSSDGSDLEDVHCGAPSAGRSKGRGDLADRTDAASAKRG